jgi:DNA-binding response OmpR family regulator
MSDALPQPNVAAPKVVIADDETFISLAYKEGFERAGFSVTTAGDGAEALAKIKEVVPNIVLLDLIMPKLNGFEVLKELKSDPTLQAIPVVILSNLSQVTDAEETKKLGAIDFIIKSDVSLQDLIAKINLLLKR